MLTREEAINLFRELDEAGLSPALSAEGSDYSVQLYLSGMHPHHLKKAVEIMERGEEPDEGTVVRVEGQFLTAR